MTREGEILHVRQKTFVPDFTFRRKDGTEVLLEIVGFWTPEYLAHERSTLEQFRHHRILIAVPEKSLRAWDDLISTGLSFLDKLGRTLLDHEAQPKQPGSKAFPGLKIETDKTTGQRHLKLPIPKKETLQGIANMLNEFSKKISE